MFPQQLEHFFNVILIIEAEADELTSFTTEDPKGIDLWVDARKLLLVEDGLDPTGLELCSCDGISLGHFFSLSTSNLINQLQYPNSFDKASL